MIDSVQTSSGFVLLPGLISFFVQVYFMNVILLCLCVCVYIFVCVCEHLCECTGHPREFGLMGSPLQDNINAQFSHTSPLLWQNVSATPALLACIHNSLYPQRVRTFSNLWALQGQQQAQGAVSSIDGLENVSRGHNPSVRLSSFVRMLLSKGSNSMHHCDCMSQDLACRNESLTRIRACFGRTWISRPILSHYAELRPCGKDALGGEYCIGSNDVDGMCLLLGS